MLVDPVRGRSSKSVSSRARYPDFLLSDQRSAIIRPRKSRNPEKHILDFACCTEGTERKLGRELTLQKRGTLEALKGTAKEQFSDYLAPGKKKSVLIRQEAVGR